MTDTTLTALVVDDEPMARTHLIRQLEQQSVHVLAEAGSAAEATQFVKDLGPDLLFLDIRLPGLTGIEFAAALQQFDSVTQIIYLTAHARYALDAFERDALDCLLKPVAPRRLEISLARARDRIAIHKAGRVISPITADSSELHGSNQRLPIRDEYAVRLIPFDDIVYATVCDRCVTVATLACRFRADYTLTQLEAILPGDQFFRIHSSWIVNLDRIEQLCFLGNHSYAACLTTNQQAPISRYRWAALRQRLGIDLNDGAVK